MTSVISLQPIYQFVLIALIIIGSIKYLKYKGFFTDNDQSVFDKLVTELALPAVIFSSLAKLDFSISTIAPACVLFVTLLITLILAYIFCRFCKFSPPISGTIIMAAGFGSTATMASPLIYEFFSSQPDVIQKGLTIGTLGVAFPFFTLGVLIASYFGAQNTEREVRISDTLKKFFMTPIFISFIVGILLAFLLQEFRIPGTVYFVDIFTNFFTIINVSINLLIWIALGLMLRPIKIKFFIPILFVIICIKMLFEPFIATFLATSLGLSLINQHLLILENAVPSGAIAAVLASRYGCDSSLAGWIIVGTYVASLITMPLVFMIYQV
jgi:malate permease and related proteins